MARRSDHTREELFNLILSQAVKIVEAEGYPALTARRVAQAIGYSPGTLYNMFANLDELALHVNGRTLDLLDQSLAKVRLGGEPESDILALAQAYLAFLETKPRLWEMLFEYRMQEEAPLPDWFMAKIQALLSQVEAALSPLFKPSQHQKRAEAAQVLWASLHGIGSLATSGKLEVVTGGKMEKLVRSLVTNYIGGLKAAHAG